MINQNIIYVYLNWDNGMAESTSLAIDKLKEIGCVIDFGHKHYESTVKIIPEFVYSAKKSDFAVFLRSKVGRHCSNIDFEYGFFCSSLGIDRVALLVDECFTLNTSFNKNLIPRMYKFKNDNTVYPDRITPLIQYIQKKGKKIPSIKPKVFISYNHEDSTIADKVKNYLEDNGIQVTIDKDSIEASENITKFIYRCIRQNDVIISIVSTKSLQSAWVGQESIYSLVAENVDNKYFIACRIDAEYTKKKFLIGEITRINGLIKEKESDREELAALDVDTADTDMEISRLRDLKNNLSKIIRRLKEANTIDISENEFEKGMEKITTTIAKVISEKENGGVGGVGVKP